MVARIWKGKNVISIRNFRRQTPSSSALEQCMSILSWTSVGYSFNLQTLRSNSRYHGAQMAPISDICILNNALTFHLYLQKEAMWHDDSHPQKACHFIYFFWAMENFPGTYWANKFNRNIFKLQGNTVYKCQGRENSSPVIICHNWSCSRTLSQSCCSNNSDLTAWWLNLVRICTLKLRKAVYKNDWITVEASSS